MKQLRITGKTTANRSKQRHRNREANQ